jgi:HPr kinase/phosphorylase
MPRLSVQRLFDERRERLDLHWVAGAAGAGREMTAEMLERPGVGLIGHLNPIHPLMVQVLGRSEAGYLEGLEPEERERTTERLCSGDTIVVIACDGVSPHAALEQAASKGAIPLLVTPRPSQEIINALRPWLQAQLGQVTTLHGVFLDVLEIGVMITGDSSIGKSELALELISRGHGLVADDAVELQQIGPDTISGRCPPMLRDFLEVRGLGVLNIRSIFGETAVRPRKILRVIVHLEGPGGNAEKDRLSTAASTRTILGVEIPLVTLAVAPGRNLAVLVEAAVRNHILVTRGIDSTRDFIERQAAVMRDESPRGGGDG